MQLHRALTLVELLIGIALLGVVLLGVGAFDFASRYFLQSNERKTQVVSELSYIVEHLAKYVMQATGDITNQGIVVGGGGTTVRIRNDINGTPSDYSDDVWRSYTFDSVNHRLIFDPNTSVGGDEEVLSSRVVVCHFFSPSPGVLSIDNMEVKFSPGSSQRENPSAYIYSIKLVSFVHSTN